MDKDRIDNIEREFKAYYAAHRDGKFSKAEKGYQEILKKRPDWGRALNALGNLFLDQNRPDKAKPVEKKTYNRLEMFDILQDWAFPTKFDLIYSSDVFVYFGKLDAIIQSASSYLVSGGKIAFSVEELKNNTKDYQLFPSGRYAHSQKYIQEILKRHELEPIKISKTDIRNQSGNPVKGLLTVSIKQ